MAGEPPKPQSWWQTLPGILTAVAGIITAATGLIVALNQAGFFSPGEKKDSSTSTQTSISSAGKPDKAPTDVVNLEKVKEAMVKAQNEIHGVNATSFEQIVESR